MSKYINVNHSNHIQQIRINRPDKKNALDVSMYQSMADIIKDANNENSIRVTTITGTGDIFCSGNDINDFLKNPITGESSPVIQFIFAIASAEKPIIAAVNGPAIGIGTTMLLHCDLVYASNNAFFQLPFVNIGICPEAGSSYILPSLIGHHNASELMLLGDRFDAETAKQYGIVNKVMNPEKLDDTTLQAAKRIAEQPPYATKTTKRLLKESTHNQVVTAIQRENESLAPMIKGEEATEAFTAFMEKRKPDFSKF